MICQGSVKKKIEQEFLNTIPVFGKYSNDIVYNLSQCTKEQQILMRFLYASMPYNDIADYDFSLYLEYANHALFLRDQVEWCRQIPDKVFFNEVAHYRINSENITNCRKIFYDMLMPRIQGKTMKEAVLEINYWCAQQVIYQASDFRTASPLTVFRSGIGRCGEESTFTVTALRSVGIPARQVYAPYWAHCDDNHAWVEVWCDGEWYFLGACEPDAVLNTGWFTGPASRALLIHSRSFTPLKQDNIISKEGMVTFSNRTSFYGKTKEVTVTVINEQGLLIEGAVVEFQILNSSELLTAATLLTDDKGRVVITLGLGDIFVHVNHKEGIAEGWLQVETEKELTLCLNEKRAENQWIEYTVKAPKDCEMHPVNISPEQAEENKRRVIEGDDLRNERVAGFYNKTLGDTISDVITYESSNVITYESPDGRDYLKAARGNFQEVYKFLTEDNNPLRMKLLENLSNKDYLDLSGEILEEHMEWSEPYANNIAESIFTKYILSPRIHYENLTKYRKYITEYFTKEQKEEFRRNPNEIWKYLEENIKYIKEKDYQLLIISPAGALQQKQVNEVSRKVLFVAICRTLGISSRLNPVDNVPEYYENNNFVPVTEEMKGSKKGILKLHIQEETKWIYNQTWTLGRLEKGNYKTLELSGELFHDNNLLLSLYPAEYRIITSNRVPTGNILAAEYRFSLEEGEGKEITLWRREATEEHLLSDIQLPDLTFTDRKGNTLSMSEITGKGKNILVWLEEGKEPTEHILNEMLQLSNRLEQSDIKINFLIRNPSAFQNKTLGNTLELLPKINCYYDDFTLHANQVAECVKIAKDKLPLIVATNMGRNAVYASSGYNVGVVELIVKILKE